MKSDILSHQNDEYLLKYQVTQKNEYSYAKMLKKNETILIICYTVLSIIATFVNLELISAITGLATVIVLITNKLLDDQIHLHKKHAASIQQYIDAVLFSSALDTEIYEWGPLPSETDLITSCNNCKETNLLSMKDWYSDYSGLPELNQIFFCQRENVRWNYDLNNKYKNFCMKIMLGVIAMVGVLLFFTNPNFIHIIYICSWFLPLLEYLYLTYDSVKKSITLLQKLEQNCDEIEENFCKDGRTPRKETLLSLQNQIRNRRENGYMIPDWFYKRHKDDMQHRENEIAKRISKNN